MRRLLLIPWLGALACLGGGGPGLEDKDDASKPPSGLDELDASRRSEVDLGDPFAILGAAPSHGPFTGGTRALLQGRGFPSRLRVWIGNTEIDASAILATDPTRAAVTTPPGDPGPQPIKVRDDKTAKERVLEGGFFYDAFVVRPDTGSTTGGTRVAIEGKGTQWVPGTTVDFAGAACVNVNVIDTTHLECETPAHPASAVDVTITTPDSKLLQARDAFIYNDSPDGYRGGLSGGALSGQLKVIALDNWTGFPIAGATVIAGSALGSAKVQLTNNAGVAELKDPQIKGKITVTVAEKCHQPMTFVDVPVDRATIYLDPVMDLACASGDPPSVSGKGRDAGVVQGELVFGGNGEVMTKDWFGVPKPIRSNERRAAYVFFAQPYLDTGWRLPDGSQAITEKSPGSKGYGYQTAWYPGNHTLYAVAGIEREAPDGGTRSFKAYVMGLVRGVPVLPKVGTTGVEIPMNILLSHEVEIAPQSVPSANNRPDRVRGKLALTVGPQLYAFLPQDQTVSFLPNPQNLTFTGQPSFISDLTGESYVASAAAVTGFNEGPPMTVVQKYKTTNHNTPIAITGFLPVPKPITPGAAQWDGKHVTAQTSGTYDLLETVVNSGGGLVSWTIVSPAVSDFDVPDLAAAGTKLGLVKGPIVTRSYVARIDNFSYSAFRFGWLYSSSWSAYAYDAASGLY